MESEYLNCLIRLLEGTEKPIPTLHNHKALSNEDLAVLVRNAIKNVDTQLHSIHAKC